MLLIAQIKSALPYYLHFCNHNKPRTPKRYINQITELSNYQITKLSNCQIVELSNWGIVELSNCRIAELTTLTTL